ncbi:MAG TPA: hypothetical protein VFX89_14820 [Gammaproteobacteria bacterium]|nr:hypothetical protein [Gammaproteobacteria bacterium]
MSIRQAIAARTALRVAAIVLLCTTPLAIRAQSLPDWNGIWIGEGLAAEISGFPGRNAPYKLLGNDAPWNEQGQARVQASRAVQSDKKANGWGFPLMMNSAAPLQFLITPRETLIINIYRDVRHVYTDGRKHPAEEDRWPTTWGDSVGRWEGETLVIDTVSVRKPDRYFFSNPPLSEQAHYVERLRMTGKDRIESVITIEDPLTLSKPWVVNLVYERAKGLDRLIHDDYDNDRSEVENGVFTIAPPKE